MDCALLYICWYKYQSLLVNRLSESEFEFGFSFLWLFILLNEMFTDDAEVKNVQAALAKNPKCLEIHKYKSMVQNFFGSIW